MDNNIKKFTPEKLGAIQVFLGAFFWSLNAPLIKLVSLDPFLACCVRAGIAGITLMPFIRPKKLKFSKWTVLYMFSLASLCIAVVVSLSLTSATIAVGMQYTSIFWIFCASAVYNRQIYYKGLPAMILILIGIVLFMLSGIGTNQSIWGNLLALSEGISFALMTYSCQKSGSENPIGLASIGNLFTAILVFVVSPVTFGSIMSLQPNEWFILFILGTVQVAAGYAFYNLGVKYVAPQKAAIISLWEMILGPLWVAIFLKDYPNFVVLLGFVFILGGIFLDLKIHAAPKGERN